MTRMTEAKAREIWATPANKLGKYTHKQLYEADAWIRRYALKNFENGEAKELPRWARDIVFWHVRQHFGSVEVDELLTKFNCYPDWMS